jgi:hypothetical protein
MRALPADSVETNEQHDTLLEYWDVSPTIDNGAKFALRKRNFSECLFRAWGYGLWAASVWSSGRRAAQAA